MPITNPNDTVTPQSKLLLTGSLPVANSVNQPNYFKGFAANKNNTVNNILPKQFREALEQAVSKAVKPIRETKKDFDERRDIAIVKKTNLRLLDLNTKQLDISTKILKTLENIQKSSEFTSTNIKNISSSAAATQTAAVGSAAPEIKQTARERFRERVKDFKNLSLKGKAGLLAGHAARIGVAAAVLGTAAYAGYKYYTERDEMNKLRNNMLDPNYTGPNFGSNAGVDTFGNGGRPNFGSGPRNLGDARKPEPTIDTSELQNGYQNPNRPKGHPEGPDYSTEYQRDRKARFSQEIQNPELMNKLHRLAYTEVGSDPKEQQRFMETVFNRAQHSNKSLGEILDSIGPGKYYPGIKDVNLDPENTKSLIDKIMKGSNMTKSATDNASNQEGNPVADRRAAAGATGEWSGGGRDQGEFLYRGGKNAGRYRTNHGVKAEDYEANIGRGNYSLGHSSTASQLKQRRQMLEEDLNTAPESDRASIQKEIETIRNKETQLKQQNAPNNSGIGSDRSEANARRADNWIGSLQFGDQTYRYGTGHPGAYNADMKRGSVPFGTFSIAPGIRNHGQYAGNSFTVRDMFDPKWGTKRSHILFHSARDLDKLYSAGCFAIDPRQWPKFRAQMLETMQKHGELVVQVNKDGSAKIMPKSQMPNANSNTSGPVQSSSEFIDNGQKQQQQQPTSDNKSAQNNITPTDSVRLVGQPTDGPTDSSRLVGAPTDGPTDSSRLVGGQDTRAGEINAAAIESAVKPSTPPAPIIQNNNETNETQAATPQTPGKDATVDHKWKPDMMNYWKQGGGIHV